MMLSYLSHVQAMVDLCLATSARQQKSSLSGFFQTHLQQQPSLGKLLDVCHFIDMSLNIITSASCIGRNAVAAQKNRKPRRNGQSFASAQGSNS